MSGIDDIISNTIDKNYAKANDAFNNTMQGKVNDALDQHMAAIAQTMMGQPPQAEEDGFPDNIELSNDDLDDFVGDGVDPGDLDGDYADDVDDQDEYDEDDQD